MSTLLVAVTGYGPPNLEHKAMILAHNIRIIKNTFTGTVSVKIFNHGDQTIDNNLIDTSSQDTIVEEIMKKGYIGQFIYQYLSPETIKADYIICILDDVQLDPAFNIDRAIRNIDIYDLDIIQPALTPTSKHSHKCMLQDKRHGFKGMRLSQFLEYFCYIMTPTGYRKWYSMMDQDSTWLWGIDLCMHLREIRMGLIDMYPMHHYYMRTGITPVEGPCPKLELNNTLLRLYGKTNKAACTISEYVVYCP